MTIHFEHVPLLLSPAEIARATGVSERSQRNWRARGYLKPLEEGKHFRADVFDLALLIIANLISDRLPVERAISLAEGCAKRVAFHALCQKEAWQDAELCMPYDQFFMQQAVRAVSERFTKYGRVIPSRYFILWADGSEYWTPELNETFKEATADQLRGAALVLDLDALGRELLDRKKPLMRLIRVEKSGSDA